MGRYIVGGIFSADLISTMFVAAESKKIIWFKDQASGLLPKEYF